MTPLTLSHAEILPPGQMVHIARATLDASRPKRLHDHDFFELFWVQNGEVRHHLPSGKETLREGAMVFLRPGQAHGLQGRGDYALVVSLSFHPDLIADLARPDLAGTGWWRDGETPGADHRDIRQMAELNRAALTLEEGPCDALAAEAFLLPLLSDLRRDRAPDTAPDWLRSACSRMRDPALYREGVPALVALTGRSHEHVARAMRRHYGQTPTDFVNDIRMGRAARALTTDAAPMDEIAAAVGLSNLSHFHKLFRARHGQTPHRFRRQFQRHVLQPE